jgi:hypothetical protein
MLLYVDKPKAIYVFRPTQKDEAGSVRVASISKRSFDVQIISGVAVTEEENRQIQTVADRYKAAADSQRQWSALTFPETTRQVLAYYTDRASKVEKQLIVATIRSASRAVREKNSRPVAEEAPAVSQKAPLAAVLQPSPNVVAAALYKVLTRERSSKVSGDPSRGEKTRIDGIFDLQEVARTLLAHAQ